MDVGNNNKILGYKEDVESSEPIKRTSQMKYMIKQKSTSGTL